MDFLGLDVDNLLCPEFCESSSGAVGAERNHSGRFWVYSCVACEALLVGSKYVRNKKGRKERKKWEKREKQKEANETN